MKNILLRLLTLLSLLLISCNKEVETPESIAPGIIENKTFNTTLLLDGNNYDGTVVKNCIFENITGDGLQLRNLSNVIIENCIFRNISGDAIRFRNSGTTNQVQILNNQIYNIEENGILAPEQHTNKLISGNTIYNVATNNQSSLIGSPHHGIYFQGKDVRIENNTIYDIINTQGNCISIRTSGTIRNNILHHATDHGISYFSDHPASLNALLIENNLIYDNGKRGINLASNGTNENHIEAANIRCNTILSTNQSPIGVNDNLNDVFLQFTGNILLRTDGSNTFIFSSNSYTDEQNLKTAGDIGFVDFANRNLEILANSYALNYVTSNNVPSLDFNGNPRGNPTAAGAYDL